jgi:hypothetical protein
MSAKGVRPRWLRGVLGFLTALALSNAAHGQDSDTESAPADGSSSDAPASPPPAVPVLRLTVFAGGGLGTRSMQRRVSTGGVQRLAESVFPAADIGLHVRIWPEEEFSLDVLARYETSLGWSVEETPPFALGDEQDVRAERAELSVGPSFRLGASPNSAALTFPVGLMLRTLWPELQDQLTPGYSLVGAHLRAELSIGLGEALRVRLGPEVQWIFAIDRAILDAGITAMGIAVGGEAVLQIPLGRNLALEFAYRESHAFAPREGETGRIFKDVERFATARLAGTL